MVCGTVAAMRRAEASLASGEMAHAVELHRTEYPVRDLTILDILPPGCSKGTALRRLAERRGLQPDEILAIGDNWNDFEMLEFAGQAAVMSSGAPDLVERARQKGWQIAPGNDEDGVAQIVESVLASSRV
jgi:hydroxymethylpyrimidine pyrophosphatase-like HAD family hydrolase